MKNFPFLPLKRGNTSADYAAPAHFLAKSGRTSFLTLLKGCFLLAALLLSSTAALAQTTRYVKFAASGSGNGSDWANASADLQAMIAASASGDEIWVAAGTYKPTTTTTRGISFVVPSGLKIYGGFAGTEGLLSERDVAANASILSGEIGNTGDLTDNSIRVVTMNGSAAGTRLDGLTISDGYSTGNYGGGLFLFGASTVDVAYCTFINNTAFIGGGIALFHDTANISHSTFLSNHAFHDGAGIYAEQSTLQVTNSIFRSGLAGDSGGAYSGHNSATATFTNCLMYANTASNFNGAACYNESSAITLENCTVANNTGRPSLGFPSPGTIKNCIVWGNSSLFGNNGSTANNSILQPTSATYNGSGNSTADPRFINPSDPDGADDIWGTSDDGLVPTACSPAIDAGDATNAPTTDLAGNPRVDVADLPFSIVDMGAYELQDPTSPRSVTSVVVSNVSDCTGFGTTCITDDFFTADITLTFAGIPESGTLEISSPFFAAPYSISVGDLSGSTYQITDIQMSATTAVNIIVEAHFSATPDCYASSAGPTAPASCSGELYYAPIEVAGLTGACAGANGTYDFSEPLFGPGLTFAKSDFSFFITSTLGIWGIHDGSFSVFPGANFSQDLTMVPCSGWIDITGVGCGDPILSGACDSGPLANSIISEIILSNASTCNDNGTNTVADDYFTADVQVNFTFAATSGDQTLKRGSTVLATKSSADLTCVTTWTFFGVQMAADGADLILTAEFSPTATFTSPNLGTAPAAVVWFEDADGDTYGDAASSVMACDQPSGYVSNSTDNCPAVANADQADLDLDGIGDACDATLNACDALGGMLAAIEGSSIPTNVQDGLIDKIDQAITKLESGNINGATGSLNAFINQVTGQSGNGIPTELADALIANAQAVIAAIQEGGANCTGGQNLVIPNSNGSFGVAQPQEFDAPGLTIFPNPAGKQVTFQLDGFEGGTVELMMSDLLGRSVWQQRLAEGQHQVTLDLSTALIGNGMYLVQVGSGSETVTKRLVVSK